MANDIVKRHMVNLTVHQYKEKKKKTEHETINKSIFNTKWLKLAAVVSDFNSKTFM